MPWTIRSELLLSTGKEGRKEGRLVDQPAKDRVKADTFPGTNCTLRMGHAHVGAPLKRWRKKAPFAKATLALPFRVATNASRDGVHGESCVCLSVKRSGLTVPRDGRWTACMKDRPLKRPVAAMPRSFFLLGDLVGHAEWTAFASYAVIDSNARSGFLIKDEAGSRRLNHARCAAIGRFNSLGSALPWLFCAPLPFGLCSTCMQDRWQNSLGRRIHEDESGRHVPQC